MIVTMDLEATPEERIQLEYATQHFGFTPDSFVETITTTAVEKINEDLDEARKHLAQTFAGKVSAQELEESFAVVKNKYTSSAEKILDNFSRYVKKNILIVPKNVVLPEDNVHLQRNFKGNDKQKENKTTPVDGASREETESEKSIEILCEDNESVDFFNGDDLIESLKGFERQCQNIQNSKYKEAVLKAKLSNLETVAIRQRRLLKQVEELAETRHRFETIVEKQEDVLDKKLKGLSKILQATQNQLQNNHVRSQQDGEILHQPETNIKQCPKTVESCGSNLMTSLVDSNKIARNSPEKRKLIQATNEDAVMAKKCRLLDEGDGYDLMDPIETSEEKNISDCALNINSNKENSEENTST